MSPRSEMSSKAKGWWIALTLAAVLIACGAVAVASHAPSDDSAPLAEESKAGKDGETCPRTRSGGGGEIGLVQLPRSPEVALLCRYYGWDDAPRRSLAGHLAKGRSINGPEALGRLVARLNGLDPTTGDGAVNCPRDDGASIRIVVVYRTQAAQVLEAQLSGCGFVKAIRPSGRAYIGTPRFRSYLLGLVNG